MRSNHHIVSVIVPTIGRPELEKTKKALERQTRKPDEVIIIEDKERKGVSWARNEGIRRSHGDLIAFTDDDCIPPDDWLKKLVKAIDRYNADGAGGTYQEVDPLLHDIRIRRRFPLVEQEDKTGVVGVGGNVLYKRALLDKCMQEYGFINDESIRISEDFELVWRLRSLGAKLIFIPNKMLHLRKVTPFKYLMFQFSRGIGIGNLYLSRSSISPSVAIQKSLLWEKSGQYKKTNWLKVFWYRAIGPFDIGSFRKFRYFLLFWLGEKFKAAGFIWRLVRRRV